MFAIGLFDFEQIGRELSDIFNIPELENRVILRPIIIDA